MLNEARRHSGHDARVAEVAAQLQNFRGTGPVSIHKNSVAHQVPKRDDRKRLDAKIDIGHLDSILDIDVDARVCICEPGVTFTRLVEATLRHGLVPMVVPELRTITVGGAVAGCSLESMSFRYGGFHDSCLEYELVTSDGEVLELRPDDLAFQMVHGSFGTLGVLTKLTFRLVPAKQFVHVLYERYASLAAFQAAILRHSSRNDFDFMDGMIHSPHFFVLALGRFATLAPYTHRYDWTRVYYQSTKKRSEDYLKTDDYLFRYDNGVTNVHPNSALGRLLFGKLLHSAQLLWLAEKFHHLLPARRPNVTVDLFIPFSRLGEFLGWYAKVFNHFPLWMVPYRRVRDYEWLAPKFWDGVKDDMFIDIAIYGFKQPDDRNYYKLIEDELARINATKTLISYNYYDEETFWSIWNRDNYRAIKELTDPRNLFRDLYDKTCRAARGIG